MKKFLVIVESPTKAKTINKYLGDSYIVKSSLGHIRDLSSNRIFSKKNFFNNSKKRDVIFDKRDVLIKRIGIDPYQGWLANYSILPGKEDIVRELNVLANSSDHVYLATDLDREGEAIAWHLKEVIITNKNISRVVFNEITYNAITKAFKNPTIINIDKVHAQQARRFMDRLVGYMLSPLLWKKVARGLSAGRVQSVVVRLIVDRERKIRKFVPKEYWELHVDLIHASGKQLVFQVIHNGISRFIPTTQDEVKKAKDVLLQFVSYTITNRIDKSIVSPPPPPFITSTLQQSAYLKFGYSIKKTMLLAQRLYEAGYITYMRTHSTSISQEALSMVRVYINKVYGDKYLPEKANEHVSNFSAQEAHEAIRPSNVDLLADLMTNVDSDLRKLYCLIWCRFIASQMKASQYIGITLFVEAGNFRLRFRGRVRCFDGWKKVMEEFFDNSKLVDDSFLDFKIGEVLMLKEILVVKRCTNPPIRYNEASLVRELEKRGIGRPSTYVPIISTIQDRGYVCLRDTSFYATKIGEIVTDRLYENFQELMDYQFTANMEDVLDRIADKKKEWKVVLDDFFINLTKKLEIAEKSFEDGGMRSNSVIMTDIVCSSCGKNMGIRTAMTGVFLSCVGYDDMLPIKDRCRNTINLISNIKSSTDNRNSHFSYCKKCNDIMDEYFIDCHRKLHVCINNPLCDGHNLEHGIFFSEDSNHSEVRCERCTHHMYLKFGRFGGYLSCSNVDCKNTRRILLDSGCVVFRTSLSIPFPELLCEKSDAYFVLRTGKSGIFLAAHTFPRSRETRAPFVEELVRFRDRLPDNLSYLADAPICDHYGNKTIIRFNRKNKQQYVVSEKNGKLTGWKSFFVDGCWKIVISK